ncbi:hypothetical protein PsYK624_140270 [Phanerochaete sordida]|uniref:Uncharacterized protein n=1 Tax=Phanerochaete sordida TaxID=48140 RepID=A0A9P3GM03_9APHY|nr:hypothetical protein PsYK624_140270 [Phanerochaete sordida]
MRTSALLVFVLAAVSAPSYGAPLKATYCERNPDVCSRALIARQDDSEAFSLSGIFNVAKDAFKVGKAIFDGSSSSQQQQPQQPQQRDFVDFEELFARADFEELLARADADPSEALALGSILKGAASFAPTIIGAIGHLFHSDSGNSTQSRREFEELLARADADPSEALALGSILKGAASFAPTIIGAIGDLFHSNSGNSTQSRRDFEELVFRADINEESGAFNWVPIAEGATKVLPWVTEKLQGYVDSHSGTQLAPTTRDLVEILARADPDDESGAFNWVPIAQGATKVLPWVTQHLQSYVDSHQNQPSAREFIEILDRAADDDEQASGAFSIKPLWNILKSAAGSLLGGGSSDQSQQQQQQQQRREFVDLLARAADDDSGAFGLSTLWDAAKAGFKVVTGLVDGSSNQQQQQQQQSRAFVEAVARAAQDESGAFSLGIGSKIITGDFYDGGASTPQQQQRREFIELLARAAVEGDESGAFSFAPIWKAIKGIGGTLLGGDSSSTPQQQQQQRRELITLLARAAVDGDESGAFSFGTLWNAIKGIGGALLGGGSSSTPQQQQQRRELLGFFAREFADLD